MQQRKTVVMSNRFKTKSKTEYKEGEKILENKSVVSLQHHHHLKTT